MPEPKKVLVVANRTACGPRLIAAVRERAAQGEARFHLVVPAAARGLHKVVDPEDSGKDESQHACEEALPLLSEAAGHGGGDRDQLTALPEWPPGTVAVLSTAGAAPHAIPVSTAVRAGERHVLLALAPRRSSLARLRADPRVALTVLAAGDVAV